MFCLLMKEVRDAQCAISVHYQGKTLKASPRILRTQFLSKWQLNARNNILLSGLRFLLEQIK